MKDCRISTLFLILILVVAVIVLGILIADIVIFSNLNNKGTLTGSGSAAMIWVSGIGMVIVFLLLLWTIYRLFKCSKEKTEREKLENMTDEERRRNRDRMARARDREIQEINYRYR